MMVCQMSGEHFDPDVQQRGIEYFSLLLEEDKIQQQVLSKMPPYSESVQHNNPLLKRIYNLKLGKNVQHYRHNRRNTRTRLSSTKPSSRPRKKFRRSNRRYPALKSTKKP
jgi:hypothetical protein